MVRVIHCTGLDIAPTTAINLTPYLEDDVARLIGVRHIIASHTHPNAVQTAGVHSHVFVGSAMLHSHVFTGSAMLHSHVFTGSAMIHSHVFAGSATADHSHPDATQLRGAITPVASTVRTVNLTPVASGIRTVNLTPVASGIRTVNLTPVASGIRTYPGGEVTALSVQAAFMRLDAKFISGNGLLDATYTNPGAGSAALTGRQQIHMGDNLESTDVLELRVLYFKECAGVF